MCEIACVYVCVCEREGERLSEGLRDSEREGEGGEVGKGEGERREGGRDALVHNIVCKDVHLILIHRLMEWSS